jgi:hypothetical protein
VAYSFNVYCSRFEHEEKYSKHFAKGFFKDYKVPYGTVVTSILDMRPEKHHLLFFLKDKLLPHAFVNIPNEPFHIGVLYFLFYFHYNHLFILSFLLVGM